MFVDESDFAYLVAFDEILHLRVKDLLQLRMKQRNYLGDAQAHQIVQLLALHKDLRFDHGVSAYLQTLKSVCFALRSRGVLLVCLSNLWLLLLWLLLNKELIFIVVLVGQNNIILVVEGVVGDFLLEAEIL